MQLKLKLFIFLIISFSNQLIGQEKSIDLRFSPSETACYIGEDYCVTVQIKGNNGAHHIGTSNIEFNYDQNVLNFAGSSSNGITSGHYTEINFGNNDGNNSDYPLNFACTQAGGGDGYSPYDQHSFEGSTPGNFLIELVLLEPSINTEEGSIIHACPSVENIWSDVAQICFEVIDPTGDPNFNFVGIDNSLSEEDGLGINFNNSCNDDNYKYWTGTLESLHLSYEELCTSKVEVVLEDYSNDLIAVSIMPNISWPGNNHSDAAAQITLAVPTGRFDVANLINLKGIWSISNPIIAPTENLDFDYFTFDLITLATSNIAYTPNEPIILFTFENAGLCVEQIELVSAEKAFDLSTALEENIGNQFFSDKGGENNLWLGNISIVNFICDENTALELDNPLELIPSQVEIVSTVSTPVWPGDANNDGLANNFDVLTIGLGHGLTGPVRPDASIVWEAQTAEDWTENLDELNYKHADCDGNGNITIEDVDVIKSNYNQEQGKTQETADNGYPIWIEAPNTWEEGMLVEFPIILGSDDQPVEAIYGLAFNVSFDEDLFQEGSIEIDFSNSYLGEENIEMTGLSQSLNETSIDIAACRINQTNTDGNGTVAVVRGIIDDIEGKNNALFEFNIINIKGIDAEAEDVPITFIESSITIQQDTEKNIKEAEILEPSITVYPMPSANVFNIDFAGKPSPKSINFYDLNGNSIYFSKELNQETQTIDIRSWPQGIYFIEVRYEEKTIWQKAIVN